MDLGDDDEQQEHLVALADFPSLEPLSHDLPLLSPVHAVTFSVDDFLLSRTRASDLNYILSDLRNYGERLKEELFSIINEEYKDFVSLGGSLKAESHRIARLGWSDKSHVAGEHQSPAGGLMAPIRDTLIQSRDTLRSVQDDIHACMQLKAEAGTHKARLELMLQLHDSIARLEDLLLIPSASHQSIRRRSSHHRPDSFRSDGAGSKAIASDSEDGLSDYAVSSGYDDDDEEDQELAIGTDQERSDYLAMPQASPGALLTSPLQVGKALASPRKKRRRKVLRKFSTSMPNVEPLSPTQSFARGRRGSNALVNTSSSLLALPQRVARTSAEYSRLRFLSRRIQDEGLGALSNVVLDRLTHIRTTLRQDLRTLLRSLLSPASLLLHGSTTPSQPTSPDTKRLSQPLSPTARRLSFLKSSASSLSSLHFSPELDSWTQVADPVGEGTDVEDSYWQARVEEQRSWLEMALSTLHNLSEPATSGGVNESLPTRNEAAEAVRELMVQDWAYKNITSTTTSQSLQGDASEQLSPILLRQFADTHSRIKSVLLREESQDGLISLYNTILRYVASTAWQVCDAAELISEQSIRPASNDGSSTCDVFVNVVWEEISDRMLEEVGSQIFFVSRPDTFYRNFTNTNLFLQRFVSLAPSQRAAEAMLAHPNWLAFKKRWQLPVYFQMRFREVITRLEEVYADRSAVAATDQGRMGATVSTLDAIRTLWSDGVHIHELSAREWRVTLQILSRYKTWIEAQLPDSMSMYLSHEATAANKLLDVAQGSSETARASAEISRVGTPQQAADQTTHEQEDTQLKLISHLISDCLYLEDSMDHLLSSLILTRISGVLQDQDPTSIDGLRQDLGAVLHEESFNFVPGLISSAGRFVYSLLLPRTLEPLRMLRSFSTPSYRAPVAGKAGASSAIVQVVHQMFAPIQTYLRLTTVPPLPKDIRRKWVERILADTFKRFATTIETNSKNQQSLNRLKKSQPPASGLLGFFKASSSASTAGPTATPSDNDVRDNPNVEAINALEAKLTELDLDLDLSAFEPWTKLKHFLQSQSEDA